MWVGFQFKYGYSTLKAQLILFQALNSLFRNAGLKMFLKREYHSEDRLFSKINYVVNIKLMIWGFYQSFELRILPSY